jgi:NDP-sugar pyrophosphorylase family protein
MQAVILAAGRGSRLHPITKDRSKAMVPILGKPMVEVVMDSISSCGVKDFILVVGPEDTEIVEYFRREPLLFENIRFIEQPERKGMAQALLLAAPIINDNFILSACDSIVTPLEMDEFIKRWKNNLEPDALLALHHMTSADLQKSSVVEMDGNRVSRIIEKPSLHQINSNIASLPLYLFTPKLLTFLESLQLSPRGEYELQDAIQKMIGQGCDVLGAFINKRITITDVNDFLTVNLSYLKQRGNTCKYFKGIIGNNTKLISPFLIEAETTIGANCIIGPNVFMERNSIIGNNVNLRNAVILRGAVIADYTDLDNTVII